MIEKLLGDTPVREFFERHLFLAPFSHRGGAAELAAAGDWETLGHVLSNPDSDVLVVREGKLSRERRPSNTEQARELSAAGHTIVVRNAQRHDDRLATLAREFERDFLGAVNVHFYATPAGTHGFGWHYDAEDVFILQTGGRKDYWVRKNSVNPWPLLETMPPDLGFEREITPVLKCTLERGDWLYMPAGYWHRADTGEDSESLSLAVGVMSLTAIDVFDFVRPRLLRSLAWRRRLPVTGSAADRTPERLHEAHAALFEELGSDLAAMLRDPEVVREFLEGRGVGE